MYVCACVCTLMDSYMLFCTCINLCVAWCVAISLELAGSTTVSCACAHSRRSQGLRFYLGMLEVEKRCRQEAEDFALTRTVQRDDFKQVCSRHAPTAAWPSHTSLYGTSADSIYTIRQCLDLQATHRIWWSTSRRDWDRHIMAFLLIILVATQTASAGVVQLPSSWPGQKG